MTAEDRFGRTVAFAYVIVASGTIITNPLLPLYKAHFDINWIVFSLAFTITLVALILTLAWRTLATAPAHPERHLTAALALALGADALGVAAQVSLVALFVSRAFAGIGLGLATGAAATLVVRAVGDRGRRLVAVGALVGGATGMIGATLMVELLPLPLILVYAVHGILAGVVLVAFRREVPLARGWAPPVVAGVDGPAPVPASTASVEPSPVRQAPVRTPGLIGRAYLVGAMSWSAGGLLVGYVPTVAQDRMALTTQLGTQAPAIAFQALAGAVGVFSSSLPRALGLPVLAVGCTASALAIVSRSWPMLFVGCAIAGFGQAVSYPLGLGRLSNGGGPSRQGLVASRYTLIAYIAAATCVLAAGALGTLLDPTAGLVLVLVVLVVGSVAAGNWRTHTGTRQ